MPFLGLVPSDMSTRMIDAVGGRKPTQRAVFISGSVLLVGTWFFLSLFILLVTEASFVPWDCVHVSLRPPLGTWQRTVNDFFEGPPGSFLPSVAVIGVSLTAFLVGTLRNRSRPPLPGAFALTNVAFVLAEVLLLDVAYRLPILRLPEPRLPIDVGYHHTWPAILTTTVLVAVLFLVQSRIAFGGKREGS